MADDLSSSDSQSDAPVTLHRVMQAMIGEGLRERYQPPQKLSHQLFVVMMQLNELDRKRARTDRLKAAAVSAEKAFA